MNKPVYISLPILEIIKTVIYEFWDGHVKQKYKEKANLCHMVTDNIILHIRPEDICVGIIKNVEASFAYGNNELETPWPRGKNKKVI